MLPRFCGVRTFCTWLAAPLLLLSAFGQDAYEPDDTPATAKTILTNGTKQTHTIHNVNDGDVVKFNLAGPCRVTVSTSGANPADDTLVMLFDSTGEFLGYNDDVPGVLGKYSRLQSIVVPRNPTPEVFYAAIRSADTQYYRWWNVANGYNADATVAENPYTKAKLQDSYGLQVSVKLLPAGQYAPDSIVGDTLIQIVPGTFNSLTANRLRFADGTYDDPDGDTVGTYAYAKLASSVGRIILDGNDRLPIYLLFDSPRGGDAETYILDPGAPADSIPETQSMSVKRFVLDRESPPPGGTAQVPILRSGLYDVGHNWTYAGTRTHKNGAGVAEAISWQRSVPGTETVGTFSAAAKVKEQRGTSIWYTYWISGADEGIAPSGLYLLRDNNRTYATDPLLSFPERLSPAADFVKLPEGRFTRPAGTVGAPDVEVALQDYVTYLGTENVTIPQGAEKCQKLAFLRTWSENEIGFGYTYAIEWHSLNYGLVKQEFHEFSYSIGSTSSQTADGSYLLSTTNVPPRPPVLVDFDVDFLIGLEEATNLYLAGDRSIVPRWLLRVFNAEDTAATIGSVTFTNPDPFTGLSPAGAVVAGTETVWSNVPLAAGQPLAFEGVYTTGGISRFVPLDIDRQWSRVLVGDNDDVEVTVTVTVSDAVVNAGDILDVELAFLGTENRNGAAGPATFANLAYLSSSAEYDGDEVMALSRVDAPQMQSCNWIGPTPQRNTPMTFKLKVAFDLIAPWQSVLVEPVVRIGSKNAFDAAEPPSRETWTSNQLFIDGTQRMVELKGVRVEPQDAYIAATRVHFHHQHIPSRENLAPVLPAPILDMTYQGPSPDDPEVRDYRFEVVNLAQFPDFLFAETVFTDASSRAIPGSRSLVTLRTPAGDIIAQFPIDAAAGLADIVFSEAMLAPGLGEVQIWIEDLLTGQISKSATLVLADVGRRVVVRKGWNFLSFPTGAGSGRGTLIGDTYGAGTFAAASGNWGWNGENGRFHVWSEDPDAPPETQAFWGYAAEIVTTGDVFPLDADGADQVVYDTAGWQIFAVPAGTSLTAADVLGIPGVSAIWQWNATVGRFEEPPGKLDHRLGYWIRIDTPPVTIDF